MSKWRVVVVLGATASVMVCAQLSMAQQDVIGQSQTKDERSERKARLESIASPPAALLAVRNLANTQRIKIIEDVPIAPSSDRMAPANDNCANAQAISGVGVFQFNNFAATTDGPDHAACNFFGSLGIADDLWYTWTAPFSTSFVLSTCGGLAFFDTKIALYTPGCPVSDLTILQCNDDACGSQSQIVFNALAGEQFLFRIGVFPGFLGGAGAFEVQVQAGQDICGQPATNCQAPDNNEAFDASAFFIFDDFRTTQQGAITSICFAGAFFDGAGDCQSGTAPVVTVAYHTDLLGIPDPAPIAEFSSSIDLTLSGPAALSDLIAGQFPVFQFTATHPPVAVNANTCYWVRVTVNPQSQGCNFFWRRGQPGNNIAFQTLFNTPFSTDVIASDFDFCLDIPLGDVTICQSAEIPANDECAGAIELISGATLGMSNIFATSNASDPEFSCKFGGPGTGFGSLWYTFTPTDSTALLDLCRSETGDAIIAVYEGTCGSLVEIACNDDFCSLRPRLNLSGLLPGQTYFVQFASIEPIDQLFYNLRYASPAPLPPAQDICSGAVELFVPLGGLDFAGAPTDDATINANSPACGFSPITAPGIWFKVQGTGEELTASLCNTPPGFDTKMNVYCGASCSSLVCVANSDDDCDFNPSITWCSEVGQTYYILTFGFDGAVGDINIVIASSGSACSDPPDCTTCTLACPPGAILEAEPCGQLLNDGCNLPFPTFEPIQCGDIICGNAAGVSSTRDTDWYEFVLDAQSLVTWSVQAELPVELFILDDTCDPQPTNIAQVTVPRCEAGQVMAILDPGTYRVFVANVQDAFPCGTSNVYIAQLKCEPIGACCLSGDCAQTTQFDCAGRGGQYNGPGSICPTTYTQASCASSFEDIQAAGTPLSLPNDGGQVVDIGFTFRFFGFESSQVGVSADGFLSVRDTLIAPNNAPIPMSTPPNGIIAPLWTNLAPATGGFVHAQTLGTAPTRRFIVQWTGVPRFVAGGSNTFQVALFETTNCIEFRYGTFNAEPNPGDYTVGVENFAGDIGTSIAAGTLSPGSCVTLCPLVDQPACSAAGCQGDADGNSTVNFNDINAVLSNWLGAGPTGDANHDGAVNFNDITAVLSNWLSNCP